MLMNHICGKGHCSIRWRHSQFAVQKEGYTHREVELKALGPRFHFLGWRAYAGWKWKAYRLTSEIYWMSSWQRQAQCNIGAVAELEPNLRRKLFEYFAVRLFLPSGPRWEPRRETMSVLALQEYEFERQFNEDEAIRWMQENWYCGPAVRRWLMCGYLYLKHAFVMSVEYSVWLGFNVKMNVKNEKNELGAKYSLTDTTVCINRSSPLRNAFGMRLCLDSVMLQPSLCCPFGCAFSDLSAVRKRVFETK